MASLPKPAPRSLTAKELLAIRGTPAFEVEVQRQLRAIAEHDRRNGFADHMPIDWASLEDNRQ